MKTYTGARTIDGIKVLVDGRPLDEARAIKQFSDSGFEWAYEGTAPQQLALAILVEHLGDNTKALEVSGTFMRELVANLENEWTLTSADIDSALGKREK